VAVQSKDEEVVLHTQEAWGSSPYAPTIKINKLRTVLLTSYAPRRRSADQRPIESMVYTSGRAQMSENFLPKIGL
jgi:hypothetical protein